jgi:hypothetical protein
MARWVAHVDFGLPWWAAAIAEWTPEVLIRFPHFLVPLFLLEGHYAIRIAKVPKKQ